MNFNKKSFNNDAMSKVDPPMKNALNMGRTVLLTKISTTTTSTLVCFNVKSTIIYRWYNNLLV